MRNSDTSQGPASKETEVSFDSDRFPTAEEALRRILQEGKSLESPVEWIDVHLQASGALTYRVRAPRAEETEGGYLGAP